MQVISTVVACAVDVAPSIFLKLDDGDDFARAIGTTLPTITMNGSFGADDLSVDDNGGDTLLEGDGDDVIADDGSSGADTLNGGDDNDTISLGGGNDDVIGGAGGADTVLLGSGDDTVRLDDLANADGIFARDGLAERLECGAENDTGEGDTIDQLFDCEGVALSGELVPDADGDGSAKPDDCDDRNPAIHRGVPDVPENGVDEDCRDGDAVNLDRDGDGFGRPDDCDDGNPRINRGARDIPGNAVNEDCRGGAAPFPVLPSTITTTFDFPPAFTRVTAVTIRRARKGSTLRISCRGAGCPLRSRTRKLKRNRAKLTINRPLGRARLKRGTRFEVRLTKPKTVGLVARYTMRSGVLPARKDRCLVPGARKLRRCPA